MGLPAGGPFFVVDKWVYLEKWIVMKIVGIKTLFLMVAFFMLLGVNLYGFKVVRDTVHLDLRGRMSPLSIIRLKGVDKFDGRYQVEFHYNERYSRTGFYRGVMAEIQGDSTCFSFYKLGLDKGLRNLYEDAQWKVAWIDQGEWGEYVWFIDKNDGREYFYRLQLPLVDVDRLGDSFYVATVFGLEKIDPRTDIPQCPDEFKYGKVRETETLIEVDYKGEFPVLERCVEFEHEVELAYLLKGDTTFVGGFEYDGRLFYVVNLKRGAYLGELVDGGLKHVMSFDRRYMMEGNTFGKDGKGLVLGCVYGENNYGLMDIEGDTVKIIRLVTNLDPKPKIAGTDNIARQLKFLMDNWGDLDLSKVDEFNGSLGWVTDYIRIPASRIMLHPEEHSDREKYYIREWYVEPDKDCLLTVSYRVERATGKVKSVFCNWWWHGKTTKKKNKKNQLCGILDTFAGRMGDCSVEMTKSYEDEIDILIY